MVSADCKRPDAFVLFEQEILFQAQVRAADEVVSMDSRLPE